MSSRRVPARRRSPDVCSHHSRCGHRAALGCSVGYRYRFRGGGLKDPPGLACAGDCVCRGGECWTRSPGRPSVRYAPPPDDASPRWAAGVSGVQRAVLECICAAAWEHSKRHAHARRYSQISLRITPPHSARSTYSPLERWMEAAELASRVYQLNTVPARRYLHWTKQRPTAKCWWRRYKTLPLEAAAEEPCGEGEGRGTGVSSFPL